MSGSSLTPAPSPLDAKIDAALAAGAKTDAALVARMVKHEHLRMAAGTLASVVLPVVDTVGKTMILAAAGPLLGGAANALISGGEAALSSYLKGAPAAPVTEVAAALSSAVEPAHDALSAAGHPELAAAASTALGNVVQAIKAA